MDSHVDFCIPLWTCSLCEEEEGRKRWPTKQQVLDHIRENHLGTLLRESLERADEEPTETLPEACRA